MGVVVLNKKISIPVPPIEKGIEKAAELLTKKIFRCTKEISYNLGIEDFKLEVLMEGESISSNYEMIIVNKGEVYISHSSPFESLIKYRMVMLERKLVENLTSISRYLYG